VSLPFRDCAEYRHNVEHSRLHQLPTELKLQIAEEVYRLRPEAAFVIRLVSRDFYPISEPPLIVGQQERIRVKATLRRDDLIWCPKLESLKGLSECAKSFCSACTRQHSKSQFSSEELRKDAENRVCVAAKESVRMRGKRTASLNEIWDLVYRVLRINSTRKFKLFISKSPALSLDSNPPKPYMESIVALMVPAQDIPELQVACHLVLPVAKSAKVSFEISEELLTDSRFVVCPYLQPGHFVLEDGTVSLRLTQLPTDGIHSTLLSYRHEELYGYKWKYCPCRRVSMDDHEDDEEDDQPCENLYSLNTRCSDTENGGDNLVLSILKRYARSEYDADPHWAESCLKRLFKDQAALNGRHGEGRSPIVYRANNGGEWEWSEADLSSEPQTNDQEMVQQLIQRIKTRRKAKKDCK
jgi:hypothetical protein